MCRICWRSWGFEAQVLWELQFWRWRIRVSTILRNHLWTTIIETNISIQCFGFTYLYSEARAGLLYNWWGNMAIQCQLNAGKWWNDGSNTEPRIHRTATCYNWWQTCLDAQNTEWDAKVCHWCKEEAVDAIRTWCSSCLFWLSYLCNN